MIDPQDFFGLLFHISVYEEPWMVPPDSEVPTGDDIEMPEYGKEPPF